MGKVKALFDDVFGDSRGTLCAICGGAGEAWYPSGLEGVSDALKPCGTCKGTGLYQAHISVYKGMTRAERIKFWHDFDKVCEDIFIRRDAQMKGGNK